MEGALFKLIEERKLATAEYRMGFRFFLLIKGGRDGTSAGLFFTSWYNLLLSLHSSTLKPPIN
jgi:hypothetical protein